MEMSKSLKIISWISRLVAAIILLQTLFFKFSGAPASVFIFSELGMEPWGRIGSGVVELIASILLLLPKTIWAGAILALGTMAGAIFFHLTKLGISVQDDGGGLFTMALVVTACSALALFLHKHQIPFLVRKQV